MKNIYDDTLSCKYKTIYDFHDNIYAETSIKYKRTCKYVDENMFSASMIMIYDNKVAVMSTQKEDFGFLIESQEFSKSMKVLDLFQLK